MKTAEKQVERDALFALGLTIGSTWFSYGAEDLPPDFDVATELVFF